MSELWCPDNWEPYPVNIHFTGGPDRVHYDDNPTPPPPSRPVGFHMPKEKPMTRFRIDKGDKWWWVTDLAATDPGHKYINFDTHAEAITYADKQARDTD